jgi:MFS family permease
LNGIGITNAKTQLIINATIQVDQLVFSVIVSLLVDSFGRRKLYFASIIGMICSLSIWSGLGIQAEATNFSNIELSIGVLAFIYIFEVVYHFSAPILPTYVVEVSPYALRSKGVMIYQLNTSLCGVFNSYVNSIALGTIGAKFYLVILALVCVRLVVVYFFFPDTKGYTLEEVASIFDGDHAILSNKNWHEKQMQTVNVDHIENN